MNGTDMLVNSMLKMAGFTREQLDVMLADAKTRYENAEIYAKNLDERVKNIENKISDILIILRRMEIRGNSREVETVSCSVD